MNRRHMTLGLALGCAVLVTSFNNCSQVNFESAPAEDSIQLQSLDPSDDMKEPDSDNDGVPDDIDQGTPPTITVKNPVIPACPSGQIQTGIDTATNMPICQVACSKVAGAFTSCNAIGWSLDTSGAWWGLGYAACHYPGRNQSTATFDNLAKQYGFSGCKHIYDSSGDHFFACKTGVQEIEAKVCVADAKAFNMQRACPVGQYKVGYEADGMPICKDPCPTVSCLDKPGWYFDSTGSGWAHGRAFCGAAYRNDDKRFIEDARDMGLFLCSIEIDHSGDRFYVCDRGFKEAYKAGQCANPNEIVP